MSVARHFGAKGDGKTDDTAALGHALQQGDGRLVLTRGDYRISRPLIVDLAALGPVSISGDGGTARLVMAGPGPAIHLVGSHAKTADPKDFAEGVWRKERMPTVEGLAIVGAHPEADGVRIEGAMQPVLRGLLIRRCRHGVHLIHRDRNVIVAECHIYDNSGVGVFLDRVNLHQTNLVGNHISYCKQGGIKIAGSEVRNIQISGNDIEYNFDLKAAESADVLFDCRDGTVREATIVGNTIQAKQSPGGANVRLVGAGRDNPNATGLLAISGNLLGSQAAVLHLRACRGVVVSGNCIYSGYRYAIRAEDSENLVIGPNTIDHNPEYKGKSTDQVLLRNCRNVTLSGLTVQHTLAAEEEPAASVEIDGCHNVSLTGAQVIGARVRGVLVKGSTAVRVADCTIRPREGDATYRRAVEVDGASKQVLVVNNFLAKGSDGDLELPKGGGQAAGNIAL
ncbi:MAG TPA: right-handed parallel beta-helix repeat-containing protein [Gemmataceae bacterium]|nr:right-handed parallel beta-helix repeat-containing protein [Gemmataceae bacterium]